MRWVAFDEGSAQGLDNTIITAEATYSIDFLRPGRKSCLSLRHNRSNSFLIINTTKMYRFKAKDLEIKAYPLCLGTTSKDFTIDNLKKTGFHGYEYDFSVGFSISSANYQASSTERFAIMAYG